MKSSMFDDFNDVFFGLERVLLSPTGSDSSEFTSIEYVSASFGLLLNFINTISAKIELRPTSIHTEAATRLGVALCRYISESNTSNSSTDVSTTHHNLTRQIVEFLRLIQEFQNADNSLKIIERAIEVRAKNCIECKETLSNIAYMNRPRLEDIASGEYNWDDLDSIGALSQTLLRILDKLNAPSMKDEQ